MVLYLAASAADPAAVNPNGIKKLLANRVNRIFIKGKPAVFNGLWKLRNLPSWLVIFLVVPFNRIPVFSVLLNYFHKIFYVIVC